MSHRLLELTLAARDCQDAGSRNLGQTFPVITVSNLIYQTLLSVKPWKQTAGRKYSRIFRISVQSSLPPSFVRSSAFIDVSLSSSPLSKKGNFFLQQVGLASSLDRATLKRAVYGTIGRTMR